MNQTLKAPGAQSNSGATVTVICKIPQGLFLQLHKTEEYDEVTQGGSRTIKRTFPVGEPILIKGPAHAHHEGPRCRTTSGFAVTEGVQADHWNKWMEQIGKHLDAVKNGLIQAFPDTPRAVSAAKDNKKAKTGLERLDPNNLPVTDNRFKVQTANAAEE